jgi:phytoene synthase
MTPEVLLTQHAKSFAPAARLLARADYNRIARLYALCRTVDDLADTIGGTAVATRLWGLANSLKTEANLTAETNPLDDPLSAEARRLFAGQPIGLKSFAELVAAIAQDTGPTRVANDVELTAYCMGVAGTVGVMICSLFRIDSRWHKAATDLGCAMQLTNICRDVLEDAHAGRRYLPYTLCPYSPEEIADSAKADPQAWPSEVHSAVCQAVAILLARADILYAAGRQGLPALPLRLRLAVIAAAAMYAGINAELRTRGCNPYAGRAFVPRWRKIVLVICGLGTYCLPRCAPRSGHSRVAA